MLTDQRRAPFIVETGFKRDPKSTNPACGFWWWKLYGSDGLCLEQGHGYNTESEARSAAHAIRDNEAA
jgi:hypothetical protein